MRELTLNKTAFFGCGMPMFELALSTINATQVCTKGIGILG